MLEENQREIFKNNLLRLLRQRGKSQMEVAEAVGVSPQTFNTWCQGKAYPRIEKLTELANYFGIFTFELIFFNTNIVPFGSPFSSSDFTTE